MIDIDTDTKIRKHLDFKLMLMNMFVYIKKRIDRFGSMIFIQWAHYIIDKNV